MDQISKNDLEQLNSEIRSTINELNLDEKRSKLGELQNETIKDGFWNDANRAKNIMKQLESIKKEIDIASALQSEISSLIELFELSEENEHDLFLADFVALRERFNSFQTVKFLSGKYDSNNAILSLHSGQGGTEANDWTEMLYRMYLRYCERMGWKVTTQYMVPGNETGLSTVTMIVEGEYAFGKLKRESGTHRLVRVSPFNAQGLRQTSFAGVEVLPVIEEGDDTQIVIPESDIDFKAVRSGGAGGQHVNKTSSAVQITHIPTGITVHNSEQRSQAQNREAAMKILRAKLWQIEEDKRQKEISDIKGEHKVAGWGNQIRNYVLHPYKLVKDLRTQVESSDPFAVLDGDLEKFIEAEVRIR